MIRFARFADPVAHAAHQQRLQQWGDWQDAYHELSSHLLAEPRQLRLEPTRRSLLR